MIQEQHAERCRLFAQWKNFDFPIVQDAFTQIGLGVVPLAVLIDENGFVQAVNPRTSAIQELVDAEPKRGKVKASNVEEHSVKYWLKKIVDNTQDPRVLIRYADAILNSGDGDKVEIAIDNYEKAKELLTSSSTTEKKKLKIGYLDFRLGVAYRRLFDIGNRLETKTFQLAADSWGEALAANPNQYIWRRRIQQYGPGLSKPYPFYDWVQQAIDEIKGRGEQPVKLNVPLTGSEIAKRQRRFQAAAVVQNPDPDAKINADVDLISVESTCVPSSIGKRKPVRVYLHWQPNKGKWNNESTPMQIWIDIKGGKSNKRLISVPNASQVESTESRWVEFEVLLEGTPDEVEIEGFALFNACRQQDHACLFLRKEFEVRIPVAK